MTVAFDTDHDVVYGAVDQLSPLIRRVTANNPSKFTFRGTGTYIVGTGDHVAIIDPGPRDDDHVAALLAAVEGEHVTHVLITHTHGDHSPAAAAVVAATGATTYGFGPHPPDAVSEADQAAPDTDDEPVDPEEAARRAEQAEQERPDTDFVPDEVVGDGDRISGAGWSIECVHTPGHISNHLCFALAEESALFSGDHVMGWSTTIIPPPDGDMAAYLGSLRLVAHRAERVYYPTHGAAITNPVPYVESLLAHRLDREQQILDHLSLGPATIPDMVAALYADVPEELHRPAARSVRAHLVQLVAEDRIGSDAGEATADATYSRH
ncbi:MAG: MBL fold metallo-hydrolase [Acidimicrobiia bacterium]|nr:MBL fold metallo-hydrolase [Acidimicrobiia bacterium]